MQNLSSNLTTAADRNITYPLLKGLDGQGYLSPTNSNSQIGLVLIQEWWGLNKSIMATADSFASEGFAVVVPDIYRGKVAKDTESAGHLLSGLDWADAVQVIGGAANYLKNNGCKKIGILGFCMGGALTIASLCSFPDFFSAGAPFYGIPDLNTFDINKIQCPVFLNFAELDDYKGFSDAESAKLLEVKMKNANINVKLIVWEKAQHAFMNPDAGAKYCKETADKAKIGVVEFFKQYLI